MYCKNCGEQMNDNQAICLKCGVKTGQGEGFLIKVLKKSLRAVGIFSYSEV